jgi:hypothetical protein
MRSRYPFSGKRSKGVKQLTAEYGRLRGARGCRVAPRERHVSPGESATSAAQAHSHGCGAVTLPSRRYWRPGRTLSGQRAPVAPATPVAPMLWGLRCNRHGRCPSPSPAARRAARQEGKRRELLAPKLSGVVDRVPIASEHAPVRCDRRRGIEEARPQPQVMNDDAPSTRSPLEVLGTAAALASMFRLTPLRRG